MSADPDAPRAAPLQVRAVLAELPPPPVPTPLTAEQMRTPVAVDAASEREGDLSNFTIERDGAQLCARARASLPRC